jgi:hypothetical protein
LEDDDEGSNGGQSSGNEWQVGEEEDDNEFEGDDEEELSGDESVANGEPPSLVVQLRYGKKGEASQVEEQQTGHNQATQEGTVTGLAIARTEPPPAVKPQPLSVNGLLNTPQELPTDANQKATPVATPAGPVASAASEGAVHNADGPGTFVPTPPQQYGGTV